MNFKFEVQQGMPNFGSAMSSGNDLLRLTGPTPFADLLLADNTILFDFQMPTLPMDFTFFGGFFTDSPADFSACLAGASYVATLNGGRVPEGFGVKFDGLMPMTVNFGSGPVDGRGLRVRLVPEPGISLLLASGYAFLLGRRRRS